MEGTDCFNPNPCSTAGLTPPIVEYNHSAGDCSVTGGYVYRGSFYPVLRAMTDLPSALGLVLAIIAEEASRPVACAMRVRSCVARTLCAGGLASGRG